MLEINKFKDDLEKYRKFLPKNRFIDDYTFVYEVKTLGEFIEVKLEYVPEDITAPVKAIIDEKYIELIFDRTSVNCRKQIDGILGSFLFDTEYTDKGEIEVWEEQNDNVVNIISRVSDVLLRFEVFERSSGYYYVND